MKARGLKLKTDSLVGLPSLSLGWISPYSLCIAAAAVPLT